MLPFEYAWKDWVSNVTVLSVSSSVMFFEVIFHNRTNVSCEPLASINSSSKKYKARK